MLGGPRRYWLPTLLFSIFFGFMVATTGGFFFPGLRFIAAPALCDGEMVQRYPISNRRLNLYCRDGDEERAVSFVPYLVLTTLCYAAVALLPLRLLFHWLVPRFSKR